MTQGPGPDCRARSAQLRQNEAPQLWTLLLREPRQGQSPLPLVANRAHTPARPEGETPPRPGPPPWPCRNVPPSPHPPPPTAHQPALVTHLQPNQQKPGGGVQTWAGALVAAGGCLERRRPSKRASPAGWGGIGPQGPPPPCPARDHPRHPWTLPASPQGARPQPTACVPLSPSSSKLPKGNHHATLAQHTI